jgi:FtsH-binding integral membrane protein
MLVNVFVRSSGLDLIISLIGVVIFDCPDGV